MILTLSALPITIAVLVVMYSNFVKFLLNWLHFSKQRIKDVGFLPVFGILYWFFKINAPNESITVHEMQNPIFLPQQNKNQSTNQFQLPKMVVNSLEIFSEKMREENQVFLLEMKRDLIGFQVSS